MKCYDKITPGMIMYPIQRDGNQLQSNIDGFVDDTSLFINLTPEQNRPHQLLESLQRITQGWSDLLYASGGKLELPKCFYYAIQWDFNSDGDPIPQQLTRTGHTTSCIHIHDPDNEHPIEITSREPNHAHKTLGVFKTLTGCEQIQLEYIKAKSDNLASLVQGSQMTREQAWTSYHMIYKPTIHYSFSACSFREDQTAGIHKKALQAFLPRMEIAVTFPRAVVHGSFLYGGINIPTLYSELCASKLTSLITHIKAQSGLGKLFILNINTIQLLTGLTKQVFLDKVDIQYVQTNWILHLRDYMQTCEINITSEYFWTPTPERANDIGIMDKALSMYTEKNTLRRINNWRLYFQILFLSDICNTGGSQILYEFRHYPTHHNFNYQRSSDLNWPTQGMPSTKCFKIWIRFLKEAFGVNTAGYIRRSWILGKWQVIQSKSLNTWAAYYSYQQKALYRTEDYHFDIHKELHRDRRECAFERRSHNICTFIPQDATPVMIVGVPTDQIRTEIGGSQFEEIAPIQPLPIGTPFAQFLENQPTWRSDLCSKWTSIENLGLICAQLWEPDQLIQVATDGSVKQGIGCYGVVIAGMTGQKLFSNQGKIQYPYSPVPIRRTESIAVLSALVILRNLHEFLHIRGPNHGIIAIWCDNKSTVNMVKKLKNEH